MLSRAITRSGLLLLSAAGDGPTDCFPSASSSGRCACDAHTVDHDHRDFPKARQSATASSPCDTGFDFARFPNRPGRLDRLVRQDSLDCNGACCRRSGHVGDVLGLDASGLWLPPSGQARIRDTFNGDGRGNRMKQPLEKSDGSLPSGAVAPEVLAPSGITIGLSDKRRLADYAELAKVSLSLLSSSSQPSAIAWAQKERLMSWGCSMSCSALHWWRLPPTP